MNIFHDVTSNFGLRSWPSNVS